MDFTYFMQLFQDHLMVPILGAIGAGIAIYVTRLANKIDKRKEIKDEIDSIGKRTKARKEILDSLRPMVEGAVASNMQLANTMKEHRGGKLSDSDIVELNNSAMELIMNTLPNSLTDEDGILLEIVGGQNQLQTAIKVMMEQYVYEYKLKQPAGKKSNSKEINYPHDNSFDRYTRK